MSDYDDMDAVFYALSHESRRKMLDIIKTTLGISVGQLAQSFDVSRIAVMKHLAVLEAANLVTSLKEGRSRHLYFNSIPIQMIYDRWTDEYSQYWSSQLTSIKYRAEQKTKKDK